MTADGALTTYSGCRRSRAPSGPVRKASIMRHLLLAPLLLMTVAATGPGAAPFTVAEIGRGFARLQDAVDAASARDGTVVVSPGTWRECAVQNAGTVTIRAARAGTAVFDGTTCEGKAALVLRGRAAAVDGVVFRGLRVRDGNGAGIRLEKGDLHVANAMFLDSQEGILGGGDASEHVTIDRSTFSGLGQCDESTDCAHSIYLGTIGDASVTRSRFERGHGGHYLKARAARVSVADNSFDDTAGHKTNYMIDLSNGATGLITRNTFVQGRDKENWSAFIVVAAEARSNPSAGLRVEGNTATLAPGNTHTPAFVADLSHERLALGANRLGAGLKPLELR